VEELSGVPVMQGPHLIAVSGPQQGRTFPLAGARHTIGRNAESDIQLLDIAVSRCHCELVVGGGPAAPWTVRDLESRFGTFVNGQPVGERELSHGDLVQVAGTLLLFLTHDTPEAAEAAPPLAAEPLWAQSTVQRRLEGNPFLQPAPGAAAPAELLRLCVAVQIGRAHV
jgi:pSer/pThr/pTyr-binding forkhead associated (FHA) protein